MFSMRKYILLFRIINHTLNEKNIIIVQNKKITEKKLLYYKIKITYAYQCM